MIQRIQSLYLLLTTALSVLFLNGNIIKFIDKTNKALTIKFEGISRTLAGGGTENIEKLILLSGLLLLVPVLSFITIFFYKNRKSQLRMVKALLGVVLIMISCTTYYALYVTSKFDVRIVPSLNLALPVLMLLLSYLAFRGIKKDINLIKSYDRLR